jgi:mesencephalic astrocyte-derived neurotrophic factor
VRRWVATWNWVDCPTFRSAVCIKVVSDIHKKLSTAQRKDQSFVEDYISSYCSKLKTDTPEAKACYFLEPIKREVSVPTKNGVPADRICKRLKKKAMELCSVRYPEELDLSQVDLKKLRVRQLRKILSDQGLPCDGCIEKGDYIREIRKALAKDEL